MFLTFNLFSFFPTIYDSYFNVSFFKRLKAENKLIINIYDLKAEAKKLKISLDDKCYGIHGGMILRVDSFAKIYEQSVTKGILIHPSPSGKKFTQSTARSMLEQSTDYTFNILCSRYDGIDERIISLYSAYTLSIGDYVLFDGDTGGLVIINVLTRLAFAKSRSLSCESFTIPDRLEHAQYTRPVSFRSESVPLVLRTGNHQKINKWMIENSYLRTLQNRPDLIQS